MTTSIPTLSELTQLLHDWHIFGVEEEDVYFEMMPGSPQFRVFVDVKTRENCSRALLKHAQSRLQDNLVNGKNPISYQISVTLHNLSLHFVEKLCVLFLFSKVHRVFVDDMEEVRNFCVFEGLVFPNEYLRDIVIAAQEVTNTKVEFSASNKSGQSSG